MQYRKKRRKLYSLAYLLIKQPKSIRNYEEYQYLYSLFYSSKILKNVRISSKCYSLLNQARINLEKLPYFYKYFKIPEHGFFPVFLKIKRDYLIKRNEKKRKKYLFINEKLKNLNKQVKNIMKILYDFEKKTNSHHKYPIWNKLIYPNSKKRLFEILQFETLQWTRLFLIFCETAVKQYNCPDNIKIIKYQIALFFFNLKQDDTSLEKLKINIRKQAKKYHPDLNGNSKDFLVYQKMKEILRQKYNI